MTGHTLRARGQCADGQSRPTECLACTRLTLDALPPLVPPCEAACHAPRAAGRRAGQPRSARRFRVSQPCPCPPQTGGCPPAFPEAIPPPRGPGTPVRPGAEPSPAGAPGPPPRTAGGPVPPRLGVSEVAAASETPRGEAPVHSHVKRWRSVPDRSRLGQEGVRDLGRALCGALHNCRGRLTPWQPIV